MSIGKFINKVTQGDCVDLMTKLPDNCITTIICDPPYLLEFMGKEFDKQHKELEGANDGQKMHAWHLRWVTEALRITKPGGFIFAFGGTRTAHRLVSALEDAGWKIRDSIAWITAQGFPKSYDISKALDKMHGEERQVVGLSKDTANRKKGSSTFGQIPENEGQRELTAPSSEDAKIWDGYGTAFKPAHEPIVVAMKPADGTFAENALKHGVVGLNIDSARIGRVAGEGRWPSNVIFEHHPECKEVGTKIIKGDQRKGGEGCRPSGFGNVGSDKGDGKPNSNLYGDEEVPVWECHPDCPIRALDEQSGNTSSGKVVNIKEAYEGNSTTGFLRDVSNFDNQYGDSGGASRFFYCVKAHSSERFFYCHDCAVAISNAERRHHQGHKIEGHPTQKPQELIEYLCKLTKMPDDGGGIVLDMFCGSGTLPVSARKVGRPFIAFEKEKIYCAISEKRLLHGIELSSAKPIESSQQSGYSLEGGIFDLC